MSFWKKISPIRAAKRINRGRKKVYHKIEHGIDVLTGKAASDKAKEEARKLMSTQERAEALNIERYEGMIDLAKPWLQRSENYARVQDQLMGMPGAGEFMGKIPGPQPDVMEGYQKSQIPTQLMKEFLPEGPEADFEDTEAFRQSQDAIRLMGEEKQASAAEQFGASTGFYGGRRIREAGRIGGEESLGLSNLSQDALQNYYERKYRNQAMRQHGAGALAGYEQYDINRAETLQAEGRMRNDQQFVNYQNMLSNIANPSTALNVGSLGMNQGLVMGQQAVASQQASSGMINEAAMNRGKMVTNLIGAVATVAGGMMGAPKPGGSPGGFDMVGGQSVAPSQGYFQI